MRKKWDEQTSIFHILPRHELADCLEDHFELGVVLLLYLFQFSRGICVSGHSLPEPNECAHDLDTHPDGSLGIEHVNQHDPVLGECMRQSARKPQPREVVTVCDHV